MAKRKAREGSAGSVGRHKYADVLKHALNIIKQKELCVIEDVCVYLDCGKTTFYKLKLHKDSNIINAIYKQKGKSGAAAVRVAKKALRAQSNNQGTGYIYLVRCKGFDFYKIGISKISAAHRLANLQTGCPFDLEVLHVGYAIGYKSIEVLLHNKYRQYSERGEWFKLNDKLVSDVIKDIDKLCSAKNDVTVNVTFGEQINIF